jgi:predicted enzyme related to lactoylglutathione lyase
MNLIWMIYSTLYVTLASPNIDQLTAFYAALFQQQASLWFHTRYAEFNLSGLRLALFKPSADHDEEFQSAHGGALSLCVEVTNLEAAIAELAQLGYPPPGPILHASHGREIYAYDPDGNRLILHEPRS